MTEAMDRRGGNWRPTVAARDVSAYETLLSRAGSGEPGVRLVACAAGRERQGGGFASRRPWGVTTLLVLLIVGMCFASMTLIMTLINLVALATARTGCGVGGFGIGVRADRRRGRNIREVVESLLAQDHRAVEVLVYDDQSTGRHGTHRGGTGGREDAAGCGWWRRWPSGGTRTAGGARVGG
jgi:hypothetical protein